MSPINVARKMDDLGRIVIPAPIRSQMNIGHNDLLSIYVEGERVVMEKAALSCSICGSTEDMVPFKDKPICKNCIRALKKLRVK